MTDTHEPLRVLSLGAGVQSTALFLMSLDGELPPIDAAIFADTQREPAGVYGHLWWLAGRAAAAGVPLYVVTYGDLAAYALNIDARSGSIPAYVRHDDGTVGIIRRQCTSDFKIEVIQRKIKRLLAEAGRTSCEQWMGISLDEVRRMRTNRLEPLIVNHYPLIDAKMSRWDCERWMASHGYSAPRSACYFGPYHSNREWRRLRDEEPAEFARAAEFERDLQEAHAKARSEGNAKALRGVPFLHRSMVPLSEVDLTVPEDHGQGSLFDNECAGICGV